MSLNEGLPVRPDGQGAILTVRVTPKSSRDDVEGVDADANGQSFLKVRVRAIPDKGAANKSVCQLIAKWLGLPKSAVSLKSGDTQRVKHLSVDAKPEEIAARILES